MAWAYEIKKNKEGETTKKIVWVNPPEEKQEESNESSSVIKELPVTITPVPIAPVVKNKKGKK